MDTKVMRRLYRSTSGLFSLEASIALTIFLFLMLFLYSFLVVFEARNEVGHVLLSTADSLSLDAFANETLADESSLQGILYQVYGKPKSGMGTYTDNSKWYDKDSVVDVVETRFLSYLAGGDKVAANKLLSEINIVGGFDGLDFSKSEVSGDDIVVIVEYQVELEFRLFGWEKLSFSQSCASKLWK